MQADSEHDVVTIRDLRLMLRIGLLEAERAGPQAVSVTVQMRVPAAVRLRGDYVSYAPVVERLQALAASGEHIDLVEDLAARALAWAMEDVRVIGAEVSVEKPDIYAEAGGVGITVAAAR